MVGANEWWWKWGSKVVLKKFFSCEWSLFIKCSTQFDCLIRMTDRVILFLINFLFNYNHHRTSLFGSWGRLMRKVVLCCKVSNRCYCSEQQDAKNTVDRVFKAKSSGFFNCIDGLLSWFIESYKTTVAPGLFSLLFVIHQSDPVFWNVKVHFSETSGHHQCVDREHEQDIIS